MRPVYVRARRSRQNELALEQVQEQRVENMFLHGAFERTHAELRIVTFLRQKFLHHGIHVQRQTLV
jgi:hypothetical protein